VRCVQIPEEAFLSESVLVRKEVIQVEAMQDENDMRQISLTWRPPSNTKARVACYKVKRSPPPSATKTLRIGLLGFDTGRQRMVLERATCTDSVGLGGGWADTGSDEHRRGGSGEGDPSRNG
jgi:hypothetical protein